MKPTHKAIHIAKSLEKANRTSQNLSISMSLPTLKKMLTKLKEMEGMKKAQHLTKAIRNLGKVLILKFIALNKISCKLKINRFKIPNYA
jgi:hypothetical protein